MATTINWGTKVISIPKADLTLVSGSLYELNTAAFRLTLKDLEDSDEGMAFADTHIHNVPVTVAGVTYVRTIEIVNGFSVKFEDGQYSVRLVGSNNNIFDVEAGILVQNQVQVIATNSAGNIQVETGTSGLTAAEATKLAELYKVYGLDSGSPVTHRKSPAQIEFGSETITLTEDVDGNVTAERQ